MTLSELDVGDRATVTGIQGSGPVVDRIMQLGLLPGTSVELVRRAWSGDPLEIRLLGYSLSLRRSEASLVEIREGS